jgi:hypothetical protein
LSEDEEPGWVMQTITKTAQQLVERIRQKQMKLDALTPPGWEDTADYYQERDKQHGTSELRVPAVVQPGTDDDVALPAPATFGELMEFVNIGPGISQMWQGTTPPGCRHMRLGAGKLQLNVSIPGLAPSPEPIAYFFLIMKSVEPVSFHPCILPHYPITI